MSLECFEILEGNICNQPTIHFVILVFVYRRFGIFNAR